jgi:hypothetical protein
MTKRSVTKKPKLTKWFDSNKFVPPHAGVYMVKPAYRGAKTYFSYWDGEKFFGISNYPDTAEMLKAYRPIHFSNFGWRGLAVKP